MRSQFEQLIEVNIKGRVFAICQSRGVLDPAIIGYYTKIFSQAVHANLNEDSTPVDFNSVLDKQAAWLETEIVQTSSTMGSAKNTLVEEEILAGDSEPQTEEPQKAQPEKRSTGYVPKARSMHERLADQRTDMQELLEKECVTLKLITPKQAKKMKRRMLGQEPQKAEQELVAELRNILHQQVRHFMRKNKGGPWASATLQNELRMDVIATRSLRSLVALAKELLSEREGWLKKNKTSLSSRLFGGKIGFKK